MAGAVALADRAVGLLDHVLGVGLHRGSTLQLAKGPTRRPLRGSRATAERQEPPRATDRYAESVSDAVVP